MVFILPTYIPFVCCIFPFVMYLDCGPLFVYTCMYQFQLPCYTLTFFCCIVYCYEALLLSKEILVKQPYIMVQALCSINVQVFRESVLVVGTGHGPLYFLLHLQVTVTIRVTPHPCVLGNKVIRLPLEIWGY